MKNTWPVKKGIMTPEQSMTHKKTDPEFSGFFVAGMFADEI